MAQQNLLPKIAFSESETFIGIKRGSYALTVTDEAVLIDPKSQDADNCTSGFSRLVIQNREKIIDSDTENETSVFLGGENVSSSIGFELLPGENRSEESILANHIVCASEESVDVIIEWAL
jgi:hypothetical protein